jgi:hypothetical protein
MIHSFKVQTTLSAYRVVSCVTGTAWTCQYPPVAPALPLGVTIDTVKDTTNSIPVAGVGERAKLFFNDTVTSGQLVGADTSGRGVPYTIAADTTTSLTLTSAYVGLLLGPTIASTGTLAEILVQPGIAKGTR